LQLRRRIDHAKALALTARVQRRPREPVDDAEVHAGEVAEVAVHVIETVVAGEIHLR
jgi:hypothetical protein